MEIIVAARKSDPSAYAVQKYSNEAAWNVVGGSAPNGVSATRYLRSTSPDVAHLTPLAEFLARNCPRCVAGNFPAFHIAEKVRCYNGKSVAASCAFKSARPNSCHTLRSRPHEHHLPRLPA